jgi:hypothetical protein
MGLRDATNGEAHPMRRNLAIVAGFSRAPDARPDSLHRFKLVELGQLADPRGNGMAAPRPFHHPGGQNDIRHPGPFARGFVGHGDGLHSGGARFANDPHGNLRFAEMLAGYDWAPLGVDLATKDSPTLERRVTDAQGYIRQQGAAVAAECLVVGKELLVTAEQALHVSEIITAARESSTTGKRIALTSTFKWPLVA